MKPYPDNERHWVTVSGLCQLAAFLHELHAPKEAAPSKVSKPVKAKTTNWKKRK